VNAQNIPADLKVVRRAFVPKHDGWVLSDFDYSKIEPRLTAYFASLKGDDTLARYLREGRDPYRAVVAGIYGKAEHELTEREYKDGKILYLSLMYGGGVRTIQEQFGVDRAEAKRMIRKFHDAWPIVRVMQDDVVRLAQRRGYIKTPWGRHLHLEEFGEHKLFNKLIQGSAAHMMKRTLIKVNRWLTGATVWAEARDGLGMWITPDEYESLSDELGPLTTVSGVELESHMILTIHDSINFDGPADEVPILHEHVPALMDDPMISAVVPIRVDHEVSPENWANKMDYDEWRKVAAGT
jgi:DNA polymerase-1